MQVDMVLKLISLTIVLLFTIVGCIKVSKKISEWTNYTLKRMLKLLLAAHMLSTIWNISGLLVSTAAGKWILGDTFCQVYGFSSIVFTSGATWLFGIIAFEQYFRFLIPSDHSATFSVKNYNILMAGTYILVILVATGPLYGLGEYSQYRGYLNVITELSPKAENVTEINIRKLSETYFSSLQGYIQNNPELDVKPQIAELFDQTFDGTKLHSASYSTVGMQFIIRCTGYNSATMVHNYSSDGILGDLLKQYIWRGDIASELGIPEMSIKTTLDEAQYQTYIHIYLVAQDIGVCSADLTSSNIHAMTWSLYEIIVTTVLPYIIILTIYTIIFCNNPYKISLNDKKITEEDLRHLKIHTSVSVACCFFSVIYFGVSLSNASGFYISNSIIFVITVLYYSTACVIIICVLVTGSTSCQGSGRLFRSVETCWSCWLSSKDTLSHELSEITSSSKSIAKFPYSRKHKFPPSYV